MARDVMRHDAAFMEAPMRTYRALVALSLALAGCDDTVGGVTPLGGDQPSTAEIERYARRLHLDLTGTPPGDDELAAMVARIETEGNLPEVRRAIAEELIDEPAFAELWVAELESRVFGGETADARYDLVCAIIRDDDPACDGCPAPTDGDYCGNCGCAYLTMLDDERAGLRAAAADLLGDATTGEIERRYAECTPLRILSAPEGVAEVLFTAFLGHAPQEEETRNAAAMVTGALFAGSPAGILYHRHGADFADLLDILFESGVYREAVVGAVFERYLGRRPSAPELGHFAAELGDAPDARPVILAVVSSREYFDP
jgi:hypothetical protein